MLPKPKRPAPFASMMLEEALRAEGRRAIAGLDEAGRGPLAGPVVAAAVILDPLRPIAGLNDSKKLKSGVREALFAEICAQAVVAVSFSPSGEVDRVNVLQASLISMRRALIALSRPADFALVDGNILPRDLPCPARAVIGGDGISASIAAASIIAKVMRDRLMARADLAYPGYGFTAHYGYGTPAHRAAIAALGPSPLHRLSFAPFRNDTQDLFGR